MSVANGLASAFAAAFGGSRGPYKLTELVGVVTLTGGVTMTTQYRNVQKMDPGGASRTILLPPEEDGLFFWFINAADAAENLVIQNDAAGAVVTINQNEEAFVYCAGTTWHLLRVATIALT